MKKTSLAGNIFVLKKKRHVNQNGPISSPPQKTSVATFSNLLTNSSLNNLLQDFSVFQLFPVLKISFLQNVLALLAPPFAKFLYQLPSGPWCPVPAAVPEHADAQLCTVGKDTGAL